MLQVVMRRNQKSQREWKRRDTKRVLLKIGKIIITEITTVVTIIDLIIIIKVGIKTEIEKEIVKETELGTDRETIGTSEIKIEIGKIQGRVEALLEKEETQRVEGI